MATTKSTGKRSTSSNGSRAKSSTSRKGATSKRSTNRSRSNGRQTKATSTKRTRSSAQQKGAVESAKDTAVDRTKGVGHAIADAAAKAKTPLIAGGTALLGVAAGAAIKDRVGGKSKNPIKRMRGSSLPKLDLDTVKTTANRVSAYGQQASDIAGAVEKTRKKNG